MGKRGVFGEAILQLSTWFERQKRVLPWRSDPSLYRVWVSEIMLQQTQVVTVVPYFERFMNRFPTVESLAKATVDEVLLHWAGLGYYSRARNLHRAAQIIVNELHGFPDSKEQWLDLPGIGPYTAGAVVSIALNQPEPILDGNVERVLSRVHLIDRQEGDSAYKTALWASSDQWVKWGFKLKQKPSVINQALMELGATVCTPKKTRCLICPISEFCQARKKGRQEQYPPPKAKKKWVRVQETVHCIVNDRGQVLLHQRPEGTWRAGLWDLPADVQLGGLKKQGEIQTRYVVTRHKVERKTVLWLKDHPAKKAWKAAEKIRDPNASSAWKWESLDQPQVAMGSPLRKSLNQIKALLL